jgi:Ni2+-binding GTPase involved in maturation of urease and hydrogenase
MCPAQPPTHRDGNRYPQPPDNRHLKYSHLRPRCDCSRHTATSKKHQKQRAPKLPDDPARKPARRPNAITYLSLRSFVHKDNAGPNHVSLWLPPHSDQHPTIFCRSTVASAAEEHKLDAPNNKLNQARHTIPTAMSTESPSSLPKARYIMIGGFLGAGKTTAVSKLAQTLSTQGKRVGLITNDQGMNLVDTAMLRSQGFATEEIPGGCFCCRFNSLVDAANNLTAASRPDIFIAEPVGSCTDLVATVTYPLRRLYGNQFEVAPVSVLIDPIRAERILGLTEGRSFSPKVIYIYRKQLQEADILVISKSDLLDEARLDRLKTALSREYPEKQILSVSARTSTNLQPWFDEILKGRQSSGTAMEVDYEVYAEGEALLGWLNCTIQLQSSNGFDSGTALNLLAGSIRDDLAAQNAEIAHLKMTLSPDDSLSGEIAAINLVRSDFVPELSYQLDEPVYSGQLILNLRAEADPEILAGTINRLVQTLTSNLPGLQAKLDHLEHFRPGKPTPTHRITCQTD